MKNYVIINGTNSNTLTGLMINELPPITKPEMRTQVEEIDGRDGDIITKLGYSAYDKTITIGLFGTGYDINNIVAFFNGEGTIVFSNEPDKYYNFKILNQIDYESLQKFKTASITFHCQPFKYPTIETQKIIQPTILTSEGESITLNNTASDSLKLSLKGNTSQASTPTPTSPIPVSVVSGDNDIVVCGKNVLDLKNRMSSSTTTAGITLTNNGDGTFNVSGTATSNTNVNIALGIMDVFEVGETYRMYSSQSYNGTTFNYSVALKGSGSYSYLTPNNSQTISEPLTIANLTIYVANGTTINAQNVKTMIYKGNEVATDFEPYQSQTYKVDLPVENLFDKDNANLLDKLFIGSSGTITSDNACKTIYVQVQPSTQYTISKIKTARFRVATYTSTPQLNSTTSNVITDNDNTKITITTGANDKYIAVWLYNSGADTKTYQEIIDSLQIEAGSKVNTYQPYGTTPIELCKIGTYQDYFTKNSGKNLIGLGTQLNGYRDGGTGKFQVHDTSIGYYFLTSELPNTITFTSINGNRANISYYNDTPAQSTTSVNYSNSNDIPRTINVNKTYTYIHIQFSYNQAVNNIMINEGSAALPYEPYGTGLWCKYNAIGKVVLDGSESNWAGGNASTGNTNYTYAYCFGLDNSIGTIRGGYCDKMVSISTPMLANTYVNTDTICFGDTGTARIRLMVLTSRLSSANIAGVKALLSEKPMTCYYVLATPYLSLIEDEALIGQLNALEQARSYEGTTNISQVNNDKPFIISAKALEKGTNEVVVNNIGNVYSKPLLALEGNGNVDIYLNNTQILKANVDSKMNIDINTLEAYNPDTNALANRKVIGNYNSFRLTPGNNTVKTTGGITKATITNYTRYL